MDQEISKSKSNIQMMFFSSYFATKNVIGSVETDAVSIAFKYEHPLGVYRFGRHSSINATNGVSSMAPIRGKLSISVDNINSENAQKLKQWLALKAQEMAEKK